MNSYLKSKLKLLLPSFLNILYRSNRLSVKKQGGFYGKYHTWEAAQKKAQGYDAAHILDQVAAVTLEVAKDPDRFERDGVILSQKDYSYPTLAYLAKLGMPDVKSRSVLDLGGSLGSVYFQFKKFFPTIDNITWSIVEQAHFVKKGKALSLSDELHFYDSIEEAIQYQSPNVMLLSSVLQYFSSPYQWLEKIVGTKIPYLIIDRLPTFHRSDDEITLQYVPKEIYSASYPAWIFSKTKLLEKLLMHYSLVHEFRALDGQTYLGLEQVEFRGFIFERKLQ